MSAPLSEQAIAEMSAQVTNAEPFYLPDLLKSHERLRTLLRDVLDSLDNKRCGDYDAECSLHDSGKDWHPISIARKALSR